MVAILSLMFIILKPWLSLAEELPIYLENIINMAP